MNKIILIFVLLISLNINFTYAQEPEAFCADLRMLAVANSLYTITVTMELISIPFEGITNQEPGNCYRYDSIFNGSVIRFFKLNCNVNGDYPIVYHTKTVNGSYGGNIHDLSSNLDDEPGPNSCVTGTWGFARYKITFLIQPTNEKYVCYFNTLDSKYGKEYWQGLFKYSKDWTFKYSIHLPLNSRVILNGTMPSVNYDTLHTWDTPEFKVWKLLYGRDNPWEKKFYARTTPFPIAPNVVDSITRNLILGTKVVMDTVYNNLGAQDRKGYNTWVDYTTYYDYYSYPPIPYGENDPGNTYCSPALWTLGS